MISKRVLLSSVVMVVAISAGLHFASGSQAQDPPDLPEEAVRIIESLRLTGPREEAFEVEPPCCVFDESAPAVALPNAITRLQALTDRAGAASRTQLDRAVETLQAAWSDLNGGTKSRDPGDLGYLNDTLAELHQTAALLAAADALNRARSSEVEALQSELAAVASRISGDVFGLAGSAGVGEQDLQRIERIIAQAQHSREAGNYVAAIRLFDAALKLASDTIDFDIGAFEQNLRNTLDGQTIGYTYAITLFDTLYSSDGVGDARIPPDPNPVAQSPNKEMHLASVSKTLTAILVLRLLDQQGLTPDDPVGPWLPPDWPRGAGVNQLTFRDYMTHQSGMGWNGVDSLAPMTYEYLQSAIALDVPGITLPAYNNANYAIFRVIVPRLAGFDLEAYPQYGQDELTAGLFVYTVLNFFEAVDVHATCNPSQPNPTLYYGFPHNNFNGLAPADLSLECGAYGIFLSSNDLGAILADLTAGSDLLSNVLFAMMKEGFLGFAAPSAGYPWGNGAAGIYHNHTGLWQAGTKGLRSCVMFFPNGVAAALQINSLGGSFTNQCGVLRDAFDAAWEPG